MPAKVVECVKKLQKTSDFRTKSTRFGQKRAVFRTVFSPLNRHNPRLKGSRHRKVAKAPPLTKSLDRQEPMDWSGLPEQRVFPMKQNRNTSKIGNFHQKRGLCAFSPHRTQAPSRFRRRFRRHELRPRQSGEFAVARHQLVE